MGTKAQRKKQQKAKQQQRREERRKRAILQSSRSGGSGSAQRQLQRMARQIPEAWEGEPAEDVAIFDEAVFATLPPELAGQVSAVREALEQACASRGDDALKQIAVIPRSSPLSEWRLFLRGLVPWMAGEAEAADEAWSRLDPERRPGRIAVAMRNSLRTDLDSESIPSTEGDAGGERAGSWSERLDEALLHHAKMLRRARFDRAAIRIAEAGVRTPEESQQLKLGPKTIRWLHGFAREYRGTEGELVAALERVALGRAFTQSYSDLFESAVRSFRGPRHDRNNRLLTFFYYLQFTKDRMAEDRAERSLEAYLKNDLPFNKELSEPLRQAIASEIHLNEAKTLMQPSRGGGMLGLLYAGSEDTRTIRERLREAVKAYPANRRAYQEHVSWIESKLENDRLTKKESQPLERELAGVMRKWSEGLPDDARPRLWLVDHLLEEERMEEARPHVEWLAASRQDDPSVRAAPWKWHLLEAMRLCRRKAWLAEVPAHLSEAESLWPSWLRGQWLPYLRTAWMLRCGLRETFERQREQICGEAGVARNSLTDACMMLGAAQRMRVPAAELKLLRAPVDAAVNNVGNIPLDELLAASGFFWDLHRVEMLYPAYRMHGGKLAKEAFDRLSANPALILERIDDTQIQSAVLCGSAHRFWCNGYELKLPSWFSKPAVEQHPMFAAAKVNAFLKFRVHWGSGEFAKFGSLLRAAAQSQRDPYYRYWFVSLADDLDDAMARKASPRFDLGRAFSAMFGAHDDDHDDDDDDDDDDGDELGFDPACDCPACTAARRAYEASR